MNTKTGKRRLVALVHADVKGYSSLMEIDEDSTIEGLILSQDGMKGLAQKHGGYVVDTAGDGFLLEFVSAEEAVQFALDFQEAVKAQNSKVPELRQMQFRIGINLGKVIDVGDKIYGNAVNIAARLEGLATPGSICISETVYNIVKKKLPLDYEYLAERALKNITGSTSAYRIRAQSSPTEGEASTAPRPIRGRNVPVPEMRLPQLRREFSDKDRNTFLRHSLDTIVTYFREGLKSLRKHDPTIETGFEAVTSQKYQFQIYRGGRQKNRCQVWISKLGSQKNISYKDLDSDTNDDTSMDEWIHATDDGSAMYLTGLMGKFGTNLYGSNLTTEGAARILWERFTSPLFNKCLA
jgi:class 3 adenylate cyclase